MHQQYEKLLLEIESNRATRDYLIEEYEKTENIIKNIFDLKVVKIKLEKEVLLAKNKVRSLEDETKKHLNIHRWTKLEYSDPEKFELIQQINSLQRRLNAKTEEVAKKEEIIQEKEKLYIKLKHIVARQSGLDMEEPLSKYKAKIKEEGQRLKKLKVTDTEDFNNLSLHVAFFNSEESEEQTDSIDLKVSLEDRNQYILLTSEKKHFVLSLEECRKGKPNVILAKSKRVSVPIGSERLRDAIPGKNMDFPPLIRLSGIDTILRRQYLDHRELFSE